MGWNCPLFYQSNVMTFRDLLCMFFQRILVIRACYYCFIKIFFEFVNKDSKTYVTNSFDVLSVKNFHISKNSKWFATFHIFAPKKGRFILISENHWKVDHLNKSASLYLSLILQNILRMNIFKFRHFYLSAKLLRYSINIFETNHCHESSFLPC